MTRHRTQGFTLLELLLSMAIVAVLTLALYSAFYAAFKARDVAQSQVIGVRAATVALDMIEQDLKSVQPPDPSFDADNANGEATTGSGTGPFDGPFMGYASGGSGGSSGAEIDCYSMGHDFDKPDSLFSEGMRHVQIMLTQDGQTSQLIRNINRNLLSPNGETLTPEVLASNVISFSAQYYDGVNWNDSWDSTQTDVLPVAVDITLEVQDPNSTDKKTYKASRMIVLPCGVSTANSADATSTGTGQ